MSDSGTTSIMDRWQARAAAAEREQRLLPCVDAQGKPLEQTLGADACEAVGAWKSCGFAAEDFCARRRDGAFFEQVSERLRRARVKTLDALNFERLLAAVPGRRAEDGSRIPPTPRLETDALALVWAFTAHKPDRVYIGVAKSEVLVQFTGLERWLVLAGEPGVGKTFAALHALKHQDGMLAKATEFARVAGATALVDAASDASLLVLDDLGFEHLGESRYAASNIAEVLRARHDQQRPTICTTNLLRRRPRGEGDAPEQFAERYGARVDDCLKDGGLFVGLGGESLRGRA